MLENSYRTKKTSKKECAIVKVHSETMKTSEEEKNLGDYITKAENSDATFVVRKIRAYAILAVIRDLLSEIPLGSGSMEICLA